MSQTPCFGRSLCCRELPPEWLWLDVVGAHTLAVDLDNGNQLAIARLELRVAVDRDLDEFEPELVTELYELGPGAFAEMATLGLVEDDLYG